MSGKNAKQPKPKRKKAKKKKPHAWVYPWDLENWDGPVDQQDWIFFQLHQLDYPIHEMRQKPPPEATMKRVLGVLDLLANLYVDEKEWPWILIASNSQKILQELGQIIPPIWALTDHKSVHTVTTPLLVKLLRATGPRDDWQDDPVGERLHKIATAQLLWWEFADAGVPGSEKLEGYFRELLRNKIGDRNEVLVMTYYAEVEEMTTAQEELLWSSIKGNLGKSVAGVVRDNATKYLIKKPSESGGPWMKTEG